MGERKGVNKYYPPDYDPNKGGLNKFVGSHALRERARKLHMGILIIRFELPYNIWCEGCENHIGMGVRYNAEKKKIGMYYSTPIYQFRMKCHLCDNHFEIKTDPANLDYVIVCGARRQENRWDPFENEQVVPEDKNVSRKLAGDAMFRLEHGVDDKDKAKEVKSALENLEDLQNSRWKDDYSANRALRQRLRRSKNEAASQKDKDSKLNLNVPLLPPSDEDENMAALIQLSRSSSTKSPEERQNEINSESVFAKSKTHRILPHAKKDIARKAIRGIVAGKQKSFTNFSNHFFPTNLGIKKKEYSDSQVEGSSPSNQNSPEGTDEQHNKLNSPSDAAIPQSQDLKGAQQSTSQKALIVSYDSSESD